jgi:hypothetical protein
MTGSCTQIGTLILYDRLLHIGGLSGTVTTAQTVGGTLTRYTNGLGNMVFVEVYTIIGTTGTTCTITYTDQDGNGAQVSQAITIGGTGFREVGRMLPFTLAGGDSGVQAVADVDLLATTGTAGNFGITIGHPLCQIPAIAVGGGGVRDLISGLPSLPEIETDACLCLAWLPNGTTAPQLMGSVHMIEN